jgi:ribosomal protein L18
MQKIKKNKYSKKKILRVKKVAITKKVFFPGLFKYDRRITIRLTSNNMYCSIMNLQTRKILLTASAGNQIFKKIIAKKLSASIKAFY